jgi:hypothetical protein
VDVLKQVNIMSDTHHVTSGSDRKPPRKVWPWVIVSMVALLAAQLLPVSIPQKHDADLFERIDAAGGHYSIDTTGRPDAGPSPPKPGPMADGQEPEELFARVKDLTLPPVDSKLFRDAVAAFKSLETLEFDLANAAGFDRETAARMTRLEWLEVNADAEVHKTDYEFLAGCQSVERLILTGGFHDDGFWQYLPEMKSLTSLEVTYGPRVRGDGIPDLSESNLVSITMSHNAGQREFHNFASLLTAPHLRVLIVRETAVDAAASDRLTRPPALEQLDLTATNVTDSILPTLSQCTSMRVLDLSINQITGESLDLLASLPLEALYLDVNPLGEEAFRDLSEFATLKKLHLGNTRLKPTWLVHWEDSPLASHLTTLSLSGSPRGDGDVIVDVLMSFPKLAHLEINRNNISDDAILKLADHPSLRRLKFNGEVPGKLLKRFRTRVRKQGKIHPQIP